MYVCISSTFVSILFSLFGTNDVCMGFPGGAVVKNPSANEGDPRDASLIPGSGRSLEVGNGNPLQYSCLENPMDRGTSLVAGCSPWWS